MNKRFSYNKGEWSEFYAFIKLLAERKIYAADENVNRVEDVYFPIIKIIRKEDDDFNEYLTGETVKIFVNDNLVEEILDEDLDEKSIFLFEKIFSGDAGKKGAFEIPDIESFMNKMRIKKIKALVKDKEDITMQVHDVYTGFSPTVGFSVKSDIGSPPTLLNAGKNTRIRYKITGLTDDDAEEINSIDKTIAREYMKVRIGKLFERSSEILFDGFSDRTFEDNLILIDSFLPEIYAQMILLHYRFLDDGLSDCETITEILEAINPLNYHRADIYKYKFKKMITAAALGMTPGKPWDGIDSATGGYIIIKKTATYYATIFTTAIILSSICLKIRNLTDRLLQDTITDIYTLTMEINI